MILINRTNSLYLSKCKFPYWIILLCSGILILSSCSLEKNIAKEFLKKQQKGTIVLVEPEFIYKINLRDTADKDLQNFTKEEKDSLLLEKSIFLKYVDNQIFIDKYYITLKEELVKRGFYIIDKKDSLDRFTFPVWKLNPAQLQLEEDIEPFTDYYYFDTSLYVQNFALNKVTLHTWLEFSRINSNDTAVDVLYSAQSVKDKISGVFKRHIIDGSVTYNYSANLVTISHVYDLSEYAAKRHAAYLFDYIMNNYISENMPHSFKQEKYFQYNNEKKRLINFKEGFIIMK